MAQNLLFLGQMLLKTATSSSNDVSQKYEHQKYDLSQFTYLSIY